MRRIRSEDSLPELRVRKVAHSLGYRFRLHSTRLPGRPDLVFPRFKKVIFVHGCFWHCHKGCIDSHVPKTRADYWRPKLAGNKARDRRRFKELKSLGWDILTIWECETRNPRAIAKTIRKFLG